MDIKFHLRKDKHEELEKLFQKKLKARNKIHIAEERHHIHQRKRFMKNYHKDTFMTRFFEWLADTKFGIITNKVFSFIKRRYYLMEYTLDLVKKQFVKFFKKTLSLRYAASLVLLLAIGLTAYFGFSSTNDAFQVTFNGNDIGVVSSPKDFENAVASVDTDLATWYDNPNLFYEKTINYHQVNLNSDITPLSQEECKNKIYETNMEIYVDGAIVYVEGIELVRVDSVETGEKVIEEVVSNFVDTSENEVLVSAPTISEDVEILNKIIKLDSIESSKDAVAYITQLTVSSSDANAKSNTDMPDAFVSPLEYDSEDFIQTASLAFHHKQEEPEPTVSLMSTLSLDEEDIAEEITEEEKSINRPKITIQTIKEVTYTEDIPYGTTYKTDTSVYTGVTKVTTPGVYGVKEITASVVYENGKEVSREVVGEKTTKDPVNEIVSRGTKALPPVQSTGSFKIPCSGRVSAINKPGSHAGGRAVDIANGYGTPIYASDTGVVSGAGWMDAYGYCIVLQHGNGYSTRYAHLSSIHVEVGETVDQGVKIGSMGSTGRSTGSHLHFEVMYNGQRQVITNYFSFLQVNRYVTALQ